MSATPSHSRETTAISEITGKPVNTWSEEWRAECEARTILAMSAADRSAYFNGRKFLGGRSEKGIVEIRGAAATARVRDWVSRLEDARAAAGTLSEPVPSVRKTTDGRLRLGSLSV